MGMREGSFFASSPCLGVSSWHDFLCSQTEQAEEETAQTTVEIYLCFNMPYKVTCLFQN